MRYKPLLLGGVVGGRGMSTCEREWVLAAARFSFCEFLSMLLATLQTRPTLQALKITNISMLMYHICQIITQTSNITLICGKKDYP
jgi:hypothetical protein